MSISIIVPTLEEVDNIVPLVEQIEQTKVPFGEIIFVDDGSIDGTREKIRAHTLRCGPKGRCAWSVPAIVEMF